MHDYLSYRRILAYCGDDIVKRNVHTGVPQGLIVAPLLRNNVYDSLHPVKDLKAVAFDDLTLVITMRKLLNIGDSDREATEWYADTGLHLAPDKTEIMLLTGRRIPKMYSFGLLFRPFNFNINTVKNLGVLLVNARRYSPRLEQVRGKAKAFVGAIRNLLPNVNGPTGSIRKLYYGVWESVVLYAAPI